MTQSHNERPTVEQVLRLVDQLSLEEREQLIRELRAEDFRREIQVGIDAADRGELKPAQEVIARLRRKAQSSDSRNTIVEKV